MPNTREKQIEKINTKLMALPYGEITLNTAEEIADSLIEDGYVTNTNVGKWISVKDRLPKPFTPVLVYRQSFGTLPPYIKVDKMTLWSDDTQVWTDEVGNWKNVTTHWMPLPEPPKGE